MPKSKKVKKSKSKKNHQHLFVRHDACFPPINICECGETISSVKYYLFAHSLSTEYIDQCPGDCKMCTEETFSGQWMEDRNGCIVCAFCCAKSDERLPKICKCEFYVDEKGIDRCKDCHNVFGRRYEQDQNLKHVCTLAV